MRAWKTCDSCSGEKVRPPRRDPRDAAESPRRRNRSRSPSTQAPTRWPTPCRTQASPRPPPNSASSGSPRSRTVPCRPARSSPSLRNRARRRPWFRGRQPSFLLARLKRSTFSALRRPGNPGARCRRRRHTRLLVACVAFRRRPGGPRTVHPRRAAIGKGLAGPLAAGAGGERRPAAAQAGAGHAAGLPRPRRRCRDAAGSARRRRPRRVPGYDGRCAGALVHGRPRRPGSRPRPTPGRARLRQHPRSMAARPAPPTAPSQGRSPTCASWPSRSTRGSDP